MSLVPEMIRCMAGLVLITYFPRMEMMSYMGVAVTIPCMVVTGMMFMFSRQDMVLMSLGTAIVIRKAIAILTRSFFLTESIKAISCLFGREII